MCQKSLVKSTRILKALKNSVIQTISSSIDFTRKEVYALAYFCTTLQLLSFIDFGSQLQIKSQLV